MIKQTLAFVCGCAIALHAQRNPGPPPGKLVDVGGRRLHILCSGQRASGAPAIIVEAGASSFAIDFTLVQREIERSHRICSYDRAGFGWSDSVTAETRRPTSRDLHDLLLASGEKPPYVLVGASRGGLLIRGYFADHPDEVAGFVFVDPATEDRLFTMIGGTAKAIAEVTADELKSTLPRDSVRIPRRRPQMGAPFDKLPAELYQTRVILDERLIASTPDKVGPDVVASSQERERAFLARLLATRATASPFGDRPTSVLSRGDEQNAGREGSHRALANLSTNSRHCVIAGAGHEIHLFEPTAVVRAITDVLAAVRERRPLDARC